VIEKAGSLPGIKVDKGTKPLPYCPGEVVTEGLDGLRERLAEYRALGAKFAKWRAVTISATAFRPGPASRPMRTRSPAMAALCQEEQIVPIVEPSPDGRRP